MNRLVVVAAALLAGSAAAGETKLTVSRQAAPEPALKYTLLPEVRELNSGNPVQWYMRCFQEQQNFFFGKEAIAERARYRTLPLAELPADQLRTYGGGALTQADWGARLDALDWQMLTRVQTEGRTLRMTELGPLRTLAEGLQVRFRGAIAGKRWDDAVGTAKTMLTLARHLGECPTSEANRLGLDVAGLALDTLTEMVQQPGCPNLYWALTDLPAPLVGLRAGLQGDAVRAAVDLKRLREEPMEKEELEEVITRLSGVAGYARQQAGLPPRNLRTALKAAVKDVERLRVARARLTKATPAEKPKDVVGIFKSALDAGGKEAESWKIPAEQLILLDEKYRYEVQRDERLKLLALTPAQLGKAKAGDSTGLFAGFLPDVLALRREQGRLEQRIAMLRVVEAFRLTGTLADCGVPLPDDPFTGKPFRYEVDGTIGHLRGGPVDGKDSPHYQITLR